MEDHYFTKYRLNDSRDVYYCQNCDAKVSMEQRQCDSCKEWFWDVLVDSLEEVEENAKTFNKELPNNESLIRILSMTWHWYYFPQQHFFAPSKFIGYKKMCSARYSKGVYKTGQDTEPLLRQWFKEVNEMDSKFNGLSADLKSFLFQFGKNPRKNCKIHIKK